MLNAATPSVTSGWVTRVIHHRLGNGNSLTLVDTGNQACNRCHPPMIFKAQLTR